MDHVNPSGRPLLDGQRLPLLLEPSSDDDELLRFGVLHKERIRHLLLETGALLFRGFQVGLDSFGSFVEATCGARLPYVYRSTPRRTVVDRLYTATIYPQDREIPLHSENSYQRDWPMIIAFYCEQPATTGGETPIADVLRVTQRIGPTLLARFRRRGVRYIRNYHPNIDLSWNEAFQTANREEVQQYCRNNGIEACWEHGDLRTSQVCQATANHPTLAVELWFNQAHLFHVSSLGADLERTMLEVFGVNNLPRNAFYGDGEPIERTDIEYIRACFAAEAVQFSWKRGDVLLLDNMQVAHGRRSFTGERRILVAMSQLYSSIKATMMPESQPHLPPDPRKAV